MLLIIEEAGPLVTILHLHEMIQKRSHDNIELVMKEILLVTY